MLWVGEGYRYRQCVLERQEGRRKRHEDETYMPRKGYKRQGMVAGSRQHGAACNTPHPHPGAGGCMLRGMGRLEGREGRLAGQAVWLLSSSSSPAQRPPAGQPHATVLKGKKVKVRQMSVQGRQVICDQEYVVVPVT